MFQQSFIDASARTHRGWTVLASSALQCTLVGALLMLPLLHPEMLPKTLLQTMLALPPLPPPPRPKPAANSQAVPAHPTPRRQFDGKTISMPTHIPDRIQVIDDRDLVANAAGPAIGDPNGVPFGTGPVADSFFRSMPKPAESQPAAVRTEAVKPVPRIQVGGQVLQGKLIYGPKPVYPQLCIKSRLEGTVQFTAVIGRDGTVQSLTLVSGNPMFVQVAMEAVRQWRYSPTYLNGEPVEVISPITVNFTLNR